MLQFRKNDKLYRIKRAVIRFIGSIGRLEKKTKEFISVGLVATLIISFIIYDIRDGEVHASGSFKSTPHIVKAGNTELAVLQSRSDAEQTIDNIKAAYGKVTVDTTAIVSPALTVEEKEYVTAEDVKPMDAASATALILDKNKGDNPIFKVYVEQPAVKNEVIPYDVIEEKSGDLDEGKEEVKVEGKNGSKLVTARETLVNGRSASQEVYTSVVTKQPASKVVKVGTATPDTGFGMPAAGNITSYYGWRSHYIGGYFYSGFHDGIDIAGSTGSPIYASKAGVVTYAGWQGAYGYLVVIDHGKGYSTAYAHNSSLLVSVGDKVSKGQTIAKMGSTGRSSGSHCHFEVRINGKAVDPLKYL